MPPATDWFNRLLVAVAGILGAAGIAAGAAASHAAGASPDDGRILGALALVALTQAPALLALGLFAAAGLPTKIAAAAIGLGALTFSADLAVRHFAGGALFPMSAPLGGTLMIAGWLLLAAAALLRR